MKRAVAKVELFFSAHAKLLFRCHWLWPFEFIWTAIVSDDMKNKFIFFIVYYVCIYGLAMSMELKLFESLELANRRTKKKVGSWAKRGKKCLLTFQQLPVSHRCGLKLDQQTKKFIRITIIANHILSTIPVVIKNYLEPEICILHGKPFVILC